MKPSPLNPAESRARYRVTMWFTDPKLDFWENCISLWYTEHLVSNAKKTYPLVKRIRVEPLKAKKYGFRLDWRNPKYANH